MAMARYPAPASRRTMPRPRPRLPPVTMTLRSMARDLARRRDGERRDEGDRRGHLVAGKLAETELQELVGELRTLTVRGVDLRSQHHVGDHERAGDGILPGPHERHPHLRVAVDDSLDLFGMDLEAADVDDPAASADEVVAVSAALDHVPGVDEPVRVYEVVALAPKVAGGRARRTNPQRAILHPHLHGRTGLFDQARGKAGAAVVDGERHAGLG